MLRQIEDGGLSKFMQRLGNGYTKYFNTLNKRSGVLFESKFKSIHVSSQPYFEHLSRYIHLNPLGLIGVNWQMNGIQNRDREMKFLQNYHWSSLKDYLKESTHPFLSLDIANSYNHATDYESFLLEYNPILTSDVDNYFKISRDSNITNIGC